MDTTTEEGWVTHRNSSDPTTATAGITLDDPLDDSGSAPTKEYLTGIWGEGDCSYVSRAKKVIRVNFFDARVGPIRSDPIGSRLSDGDDVSDGPSWSRFTISQKLYKFM